MLTIQANKPSHGPLCGLSMAATSHPYLGNPYGSEPLKTLLRAPKGVLYE